MLRMCLSQDGEPPLLDEILDPPLSGMFVEVTKGFPNPVVHNWATQGRGASHSAVYVVAHTRTPATFVVE